MQGFSGRARLPAGSERLIRSTSALAELGYRRLSVRPRHPEADEDAQEAFKKASPPVFALGFPTQAKGAPLEIWLQDEARLRPARPR